MINIRFHKNFEKQYGKLSKKDKKKVKERIGIFMEDPYNPILNNHSLKGKYTDYRSINITGDLRAIYKFLSEDECIFICIDIHSNLYK